MTEGSREPVLSMSLWTHDGVPVARLRGWPWPGPDGPSRVVAGRPAVRDAFDDWLTRASARLHGVEPTRGGDEP